MRKIARNVLTVLKQITSSYHTLYLLTIITSYQSNGVLSIQNNENGVFIHFSVCSYDYSWKANQ